MSKDTSEMKTRKTDPSLLRPPIKSYNNDGTKNNESTKAQLSDKKKAEQTTKKAEKEGGSSRRMETFQSRRDKDESDDSSGSNASEREIPKKGLKPSSNTCNQWSSKEEAPKMSDSSLSFNLNKKIGAGDSCSSKHYQTSTPKTAADPGNSVHRRTTKPGTFSDGEEEIKTSCRQQKDATRNQGRITRRQAPLSSEEEDDDDEETEKVSVSPLSFILNKKIGGLLLFVIVAAVAYLAVNLLIPKKMDTNKFEVLQNFHDGFRKLPIMYTSQSQELWRKSERILELHLKNMKENKAPAIILLTAAQDGEHMLHCIGNKLAKTYASSRNSDYTEIFGSDGTSEDSEDVKFEIDKKLSDGFNGTARAAVLHRLELLPPGSLLILYKYCDHENARFKNVALVLTVLLEDATLTHDIPLNDLEEKVREFFNQIFIETDPKKSHNRMDVDKLSGVWSRISHVVLPVFPEEHVGESCEEAETKV